MGRRRALTALLAVGAGVWLATPHLVQRVAGRFDFRPLNDPAGFRRLITGATGGLSTPLVGLDTARAPRRPAQAPIEDVCAALFGALPEDGVVPVAFFTDANCPSCRVLKGRLLSLADAGEIRISWHEWPLLGESSVIFARAALAAGLQGAHGAFQARLSGGGIVPTPAFLDVIARDIGIDGQQMQVDMQSAEVSAQLGRSNALAGRFGFAGTPGLVLGRTVVTGALPAAALRALVRRERRDGPQSHCGA